MVSVLSGVAPRKRFGQNFLTDQRVIDAIIRAIGLAQTDHVVEIGPGMGALTQGLVEALDQLTVVELDRDLAAALPTRVRYPERLHIISADALRFDFASLAANTSQKLRIVGNLPYNISTPLLFHLLALHQRTQLIADMHFMLQKEVVDRMTAPPGSKQYGRLSVMIQYYCQADALFDVSPSAFVPAPKVTSAICRLTPHRQLPVQAVDPAHLATLVTTLFSMRRKTLRAILKGRLAEPQFDALHIDPMWRPEVLTVAQFVALSDQLLVSAQDAG